MTKPDNRLVQECLSGNRGAWESLVQRYSRLIFSIALRSGLSEDDAADVFQVVCVKLLANLEKLKDDKHLTGWLITTAKHECFHTLRQKSRIQSLHASGDADSTLEVVAAEDGHPDEAILQAEQEHLVRQAVVELGGRCRQLIESLYLTDPPATYVDVSQRMNMPVGSIGPTRARCLKNLKERLEKLGF